MSEQIKKGTRILAIQEDVHITERAGPTEETDVKRPNAGEDLVIAIEGTAQQ